MRYFPLFFRVADQTVVIVGGGEQAAQKLRLMLKTEARIVIMAPTIDDEIAAAAAAGRARHVAAVVEPAALAGARLMFCCTGCVGADAAIADLGRSAGAVVNVVDRPDLCDAITPAIVDRDPVVVAIGTEGAAPVLARGIKTSLERMLEPETGPLAAWAAELRAAVAQRLPFARRRTFWAWFFGPGLRAAFAKGGRAEAGPLVEAAFDAGGAPAEPGAICVVAAPAADLITLRGVRRLQEADLVIVDPSVDPAVMELARRDSDRETAAPGAAAAQLLAAARDGRRAVRLTVAVGDVLSEIAELRAGGAVAEVVGGADAG
jgi:uroporphyrin-III C-methyltransferase/precorrin-2 dehydrogenase/sirohydrochlorin ferrochelatase